MGRYLAYATVGILLVAVVARIRDARQRSLRRIAGPRGWTFDHGDITGIGALPLTLLQLLERRRVQNTLQGEVRGRSVVLFDLTDPRDVSFGRSHRMRSLSCGLVRHPATFPHLVIQPELAIPLPGPDGLRRVELEWEAFNRTFDVWASTRSVAHTVVDARLMASPHDHPPQMRFELMDDVILCSTGQLPPEDLPSLADALFTFVERMPPIALARYGNGSRT